MKMMMTMVVMRMRMGTRIGRFPEHERAAGRLATGYWLLATAAASTAPRNRS